MPRHPPCALHNLPPHTPHTPTNPDTIPHHTRKTSTAKNSTKQQAHTAHATTQPQKNARVHYPVLNHQPQPPTTPTTGTAPRPGHHPHPPTTQDTGTTRGVSDTQQCVTPHPRTPKQGKSRRSTTHQSGAHHERARTPTPPPPKKEEQKHTGRSSLKR